MKPNYTKANFINNEWEKEGGGKTLSVLNKYSQEEIGNIPQASASQMKTAILTAKDAFQITRKWSAGKRSEMMEKLHQRLEEEKERFVDLIIAEAGKPRSYATAELERCLSTLGIAIEESKRLGGEVVPMDFSNGEGKTAFTKRFPIGVVACITPFNFPLNLVMHKVAPALAVGCTVVIKPAPQAPMSCLAFAGLMKEVGYPAGTINVLCCENEVAEKLVKDERVAKLSFTGSDKVGWYLKSICGKKKVTLELGGNAAIVIDEDVKVKEYADLIAKGAYLYAGQICISTQRIFVHEKLYPEFKEAFTDAINALKVGDPDKEEVLVGPIIDSGHLERINDWVKEAIDAGAKVICGGDIESKEHNLFQPTLLTNTTPDMKVCAEEIFGPVAVIEMVNSFEDGLKSINNSKYGLQAGVFTNNLKHFKLASDHLEVGGIMFNNIPGFRIDHMPYGGVKDSGLGREGLKYAMQEMTEPRLIVY